jgi:hypothetical protein
MNKGACVMEGPIQREEEDAPVSRMEVLDREAILAATDLQIECVAIPEWGGNVFIRVMTGRERDALEMSIQGKSKEARLKDLRARLAAASVCNQAGELLFNSQDVELLTAKSSTALDRIVEASSRLNRISEEDKAELVENFTDAPSVDSGSD